MDTEHLHVEGSPVDHPAWTAERRDDGFDGARLERAMIAARETAYRSLADLDAA